MPLSDIDETALLEERLTQQDATLKALAEACPVEEMPADSLARIWGHIEKNFNTTL